MYALKNFAEVKYFLSYLYIVISRKKIGMNSKFLSRHSLFVIG